MAKQDSSTGGTGKSRGLKRRRGGVADWESVNAESIRAAITATALTGGALRFGYSRDGGAYAIGIYGDGEPYTEFVKPGEEVEITLNDICDLFEGIKEEQLSSRKSGLGPKNPPPGQ